MKKDKKSTIVKAELKEGAIEKISEVRNTFKQVFEDLESKAFAKNLKNLVIKENGNDANITYDDNNGHHEVKLHSSAGSSIISNALVELDVIQKHFDSVRNTFNEFENIFNDAAENLLRRFPNSKINKFLS